MGRASTLRSFARVAAGPLALLLAPGCRSEPVLPADTAGPASAAAPGAVAAGPPPVTAAPGAAVARPPAVAGAWFPAEPGALRGLLGGLLDAAPAPPPAATGTVRALVAPHAGYVWSGAVAASGYRLVRGEVRRRVIVLGPAHRGAFRGAALPAYTHFRTPLGDVPVDLAAVERLRAGDALFAGSPAADAGEHSIEMQVPFIQVTLAPGWTIVPLLVGGLQPGDAARLAEALRPIADDGTLVVASGDFTHYGPRYGYEPFPLDDRLAARLEELDGDAWERIAARDGPGLAEHAERTGITACGRHAFEILAHLVPGDARAVRLDYDTSGRIGGDYGNSVSYVAGAFVGPRPPAGAGAARPAEEMFALLRLAARTVIDSVRAGADADPAAAAAAVGLAPGGRLAAPAGAFVTLKAGGSLRGCIGHVLAEDALWRTVSAAAASAALHDPRFPPVRPDELSGLTVEVSVLSPPSPVPSWLDFRVGDHGIIFRKDGHAALFLPEVAAEQGWSAEETLSHLSVKAGLPAGAWREGGRLELFTTQAGEAPLPSLAAP